MRVEKRQKTISVNVYIASDGKEFESESACKTHEMFLNGTRKTCTRCNGRGWLSREWVPPHEHWEGTMGGYYNYEDCPECNGKGYLEKVTEWR